MKKTVLFICSVVLACFIFSCGPSEESIRREMRLKMEAKLVLQDSIKPTKELMVKYDKAITDSKGELEIAKDRLQRIKEWQFGRTTEEREEQIKNQTIAIENIETYINKLENNVPVIEKYIVSLESELQKIESQLN